jgi:aarF domain-containing kinase
VGGIKYLHDHFGGTEGLLRSISFYKIAIPRYLLYRYHSWRESDSETWRQLDVETSQMGLEKILELEGFYIKCGQLCASNFGDAFPKIWQDTMSVLQDQVPPQDFEVIKSIVASELDMEKTFASFDPVPIGAASIGQVHRATLNDDHRTPVVVKVCYPDVERLLRGDVRTIKLFAQVAQPVHVPALEETEKQFQTEFDYRREALNLATVRENLRRAGLAGLGKLCQVPRPYLDLCTKRVLVMEELAGDKLQVELEKDMQRHAKRAGMSVQAYLEAQAKQKRMQRQETHEPPPLGSSGSGRSQLAPKPVPNDASSKSHQSVAEERLLGPTSQQYAMMIAILDQKRRISNAVNRCYNWTAGVIPGVRRRSYQDKSVLPLNHAQLVDDLFRIHGHEVLVDGFFNADPHPGNILLVRLPDGSPQLGLIDYGQVKTLTKPQRHLFARLIIALDEDNREEIVSLMKEAGYKSERMDPDTMYVYAKGRFVGGRSKMTDDNVSRRMTKNERTAQHPVDSIIDSGI